MPLPAANTSILAPSFYPDRIAIAVRIALRSSEIAFNLIDSLSRARWQQNTGDASQYLRRIGVSLSAKQLSERSHISIIAYYNPLWHRHRYLMRRQAATEVSGDGNTNWLPPTAIARDMRDFWHEVGETLWLIGAEVVSLCADILDAQRNRPVPNLLGVSLLEVEAAYDFVSRFPRSFVEGRRERFNAHFSDASFTEYVRPGRMSANSARQDASLTAHPYRGEKVKLYSKTNRRVRFEASFSRTALRRIGVGRREIDGETSFPMMFERVALRAAAVANMLLGNESASSTDAQEGLVELLIALTRRIRNPMKIYAFIDAMASSGRVSARWDRHIPSRLVSDGVLVRRSRGVYTLSARYRTAEGILRQFLCFAGRSVTRN